MTFTGGGFSLHAENVNGWAFLHSLQGNGDPRDLESFLDCVVASLSDVNVFITANEKRSKVYKRFGFIDSGITQGHEKVMYKFALKDIN